jgi:ppGpp synthetase/RelA/SpoT-type nucleotidyltranferase
MRPETALATIDRDDQKEVWLEQLKRERPDVAILPNFWTLLEQNAARWCPKVAASDFWLDVAARLERWKNDYYNEKGDSLFPTENPLPGFVPKSAASIQSKAFRSRELAEHVDCVLGVWPKGISPVPRLNDLVRTRIVCPYLDGTQFLTDRLIALARETNVDYDQITQRVEDAGYFARHFYFKTEVGFRVAGESFPTTIQCEVQIGTVLSTQIWQTAHRLYDEVREAPKGSDDWKDDADDPRTIRKTLGQQAHQLDLLLMKLRDKTSRKKG